MFTRSAPAARGRKSARGRGSLGVGQRRALGLAALLVGLVPAAALGGPVWHEHFAPDPVEDLALEATTSSGRLPLALHTQSGVVGVRDKPGSEQAEREETYRAGASGGDSFHLDGVTERPEAVRYDEPFRPSILPFKRLYAFDLVHDDFSLGVRSAAPRDVAVLPGIADDEDAFYADFFVELRPGVPVRIPSVGPGAKLHALELDVAAEGAVQIDSAENWFLVAHHDGRVRVVMELGVGRRAFGARYPGVGWAELEGLAPPLPPAVQERAEEVLAGTGIGHPDSPARAVSELTRYFRSFADSSEEALAADPGALYVELTLARRGVCRHRAYGFLVTALGLGLPTRLVHNEAHAWVEVSDGQEWMRIDLGGAPARLDETRRDPLVPVHRPPPDPYSWPAGAHAGAELARRSAPNGPDSTEPSSAPFAASGDPFEDAASRDAGWPSASTAPSPRTSSTSSLVRSYDDARVTLTTARTRLVRGQPLAIGGRVTRPRHDCARARVDLFLLGEDGQALPLGSLAAGDGGRFEGAVTVPSDARAGQMQVVGRLGAGCD